MNRKEMRAELRQRQAERKLKEAQQKVAELIAATKRQSHAEPHRNHHMITLGAEYHRGGLRACHAPALLALRSLPLPLYAEALVRLFDADESRTVAELEAMYVLEHHEQLVGEGRRIVLQREIAAYEADCQRWQERQQGVPDSRQWREGRVSMRQAWLVERTCQALAIDARPKHANCGEAHDWLAAHGANLRLKVRAIEEPTYGSGGELPQTDAADEVLGTNGAGQPGASSGSPALENGRNLFGEADDA